MTRECPECGEQTSKSIRACSICGYKVGTRKDPVNNPKEVNMLTMDEINDLRIRADKGWVPFMHMGGRRAQVFKLIEMAEAYILTNNQSIAAKSLADYAAAITKAGQGSAP